MRETTSSAVRVLLLCCIFTKAGAALTPPVSPCKDSLTSGIPGRSAVAPDGREFVQHLGRLSDDERESAILEQLLAGNMPPFLRRLKPVHLTGQNARGHLTEVTLCVSPDYLAIGSDEDFFFVPMRLQTALTIARHFRFELPTPRIVDAIYIQAPMHLQPQPLPASDSMRSTAYYWQHNELVREQRFVQEAQLGLLTAGDKKDLVLTNRLWSNPDRVAIYGWHRLDGRPIQPLSTVHGARYADYSHGVRLVSDTAFVDGEAKPLMDLLQDPKVAALISSEGKIHDPVSLVNVLSSPPVRDYR
jgi:hypothetical protein